MTINSISAQPLKSDVSFKQNLSKEAKESQNKKHSVAKTVAWTAAGVAGVAVLTIAGIKLAKSGKLDGITQKLKSVVNRPQKEYTYHGTATRSFELSKAMADEIVANFKAMKDRVRGHNLKQWIYNNKIDWSQAPQPRANVVK